MVQGLWTTGSRARSLLQPLLDYGLPCGSKGFPYRLPLLSYSFGLGGVAGAWSLYNPY
jgi:hypothetical protein